MIKRFSRLIAHALAILAFVWSGAAMAQVQIHFHSFNGSVLFGRYPHTFVVLDGTLEDGTRVDENYGFSARHSAEAIVSGWAEHMVLSESEKNVRNTNRHFSLTLTDAQYARVIREVREWQAPGKRYSLDERNCIHFVGTMAAILGLKVEYPENMLRRPKKWLNHITRLNPQLGAEPI